LDSSDSKPPFGSAERVVEYLGRYTHRVAITNTRLVRLAEDQVVFSYKDHRDPTTPRTLCLDAEELIRRFLLHVLPDRFVRIRYYGLLAHRNRTANLDRCRRLLGRPPRRRSDRRPRESALELLERLTGIDPALCPACRQGRFRLVAHLPRPIACGRSPP
jgi:hypothetical protein